MGVTYARDLKYKWKPCLQLPAVAVVFNIIHVISMSDATPTSNSSLLINIHNIGGDNPAVNKQMTHHH